MTPPVLLALSLLLPVAGAVLLWVVAPLGGRAVRGTALAASLATAACCIGLAWQLLAPGGPWEAATDGTVEPLIHASYIAGPLGSVWNIRLALGLDGVSLWLYVLTSVLMVTSVLVSWRSIEEDRALFFGMLLLLESGCLGVFCAMDVILFYICFEFTLIPLYFLIGIWGSESRRLAARKFFLYTLTGSLITFVCLLGLVAWAHRTTGVAVFSMEALGAVLRERPLPLAWQLAIFWGLFLGFAIKVPLFPFHTWLPLAHVQAPAAGSIFLAGILLKMGTYGFLRFNIAMLPQAAVASAPILAGLAVGGIVYGALVALVQQDVKRLIAYSSVSHMGYCVLGLFALNPLGLQGGLIQMVSHGVSTGALFALVGMLYERFHTRRMASFGGLARAMPWFGFFLLFFALSSIGLPGMNGFVGEFLVLLGTFWRAWDGAGWQFSPLLAVTALLGVVLGAWYMLSLVRRILFGPVRLPDARGRPSDLDVRERLALAPLAVLVLWIGLWPGFFTRPMRRPV